jgi:hypothetical protein
VLKSPNAKISSETQSTLESLRLRFLRVPVKIKKLTLPTYNGGKRYTFLFQKGGLGRQQGRIRSKQDKNPVGQTLNPVYSCPVSMDVVP